MASHTAQDTVLLEIPELLENILLHLDQRDLLVNAQRVCRQWRQCITETPSIQQHLFFLPEPASRTSSNSNANTDTVPKPRQNPLLAHDFPEWFMHGSTWPPDQRLCFIRTTEPYLRGFDRDQFFPALRRVTERLEAYTYPQASWRRMLLLQPPPNGIGLVSTRCGRLVKQDTEPQTDTQPQPNSESIDIGEPPADRPVTMPELLELTNRFIHVMRPVVGPYWEGPAAGGNQQPLRQEVKYAFSRFRVMWWRLSPDVFESFVDSDSEELYLAVRDKMRKYGIVVQHDHCPHDPTDQDELVHRLRGLLPNRTVGE
ncbi:hypothetical protein PG985_009286 [Apiospora marii]|uniref:uncharacterized protein n=1 Tax=Apiospora marii TaxID=335849 RepID=UPI00312D1548